MIDGSHAIILLFVKPSDDNADNIIKKFNYLHYKSKNYCSIYLVGYSLDYHEAYHDWKPIEGVDHTTWYYSDECFVEVNEQLERRLKNWRYSGEPEMIILQNSSTYEGGSVMDFRNYHYIDINYGISRGYIDSFARFMERLLVACRYEVLATEVIDAANRKRLNGRRIIEMAIEDCPKLPTHAKRILKDRVLPVSWFCLLFSRPTLSPFMWAQPWVPSGRSITPPMCI